LGTNGVAVAVGSGVSVGGIVVASTMGVCVAVGTVGAVGAVGEHPVTLMIRAMNKNKTKNFLKIVILFVDIIHASSCDVAKHNILIISHNISSHLTV
jgi:hypothetical protein